MKKFAYIADFPRPAVEGGCFKVNRMVNDHGVPREFVFKDEVQKTGDPRPKWDELLSAVKNGVVPENAEFFIQDYRSFGKDLQKRKEMIQFLLKKGIILRVLNFPFTLEVHDDPATAMTVNRAYAEMYLRVHSMEEMRKRTKPSGSGELPRGRRAMFIPQRFEEEYQKYRNRETSVCQIGIDLEINRRTADKWVKIRRFYDEKQADFKSLNNPLEFENLYQNLTNQLVDEETMSEKLGLALDTLRKLIEVRATFEI